MNERKYKKFVVGETVYEALGRLPEELRGKFALYVMSYGIEYKEPELTGLEAALWVSLRDQIDNTRPRRGAPVGSINNKDGINQHREVNSGQLEVNSGQLRLNEVKSANDNDNVNDNENTQEKTDPEFVCVSKLSAYFYHLWQTTLDEKGKNMFNITAAPKYPADWERTWQKDPPTKEQIDALFKNFGDAIRSGALERRFIPLRPDGLLKSIKRYQTPYQSGKPSSRPGPSPPSARPYSGQFATESIDTNDYINF
jgi:hypothetical protein